MAGMDEDDRSGVTLSVLKDLQSRYRISASKALGQNFLVDPNVTRKIAETIESQQDVVEVGAGIGSLTVPLAKSSQHVYTIEFDEHIISPLNDVLSMFGVSDKVEIIHSDVMDIDLEAFCVERNIDTIIGNLPYNISAPLLANISRKVPSVKTVIAMVQKEVGERLAAKQGTRSVSAITLKCQYFMDISILFEVSSQSFIPRPRVDSVVIKMERREVGEKDVDAMFSMIDTAFSQRRKMLRQSLKGVFGRRVSEIFEKSGVDPTARPEQSTLEQFTRLFNAYEGV